jgi:predicted nucleotidyltransferase
VLARAVVAYQAALGPRLIAAYTLGSLAHGGFSRLVSDVDLGLVLQGPLRPTDGSSPKHLPGGWSRRQMMMRRHSWARN